MRKVKQSTWLCRTDTTPHNMKITTLGLCLLVPVMAQAGKALPIALQAPNSTSPNDWGLFWTVDTGNIYSH